MSSRRGIDFLRSRGAWASVFLAWLVAALLLPQPAAAQQTRAVPGLDKIAHIIVLYLENNSFDHLYGLFPGADGLAQAGAALPQLDKSGKPYAMLPEFENHPLDKSKPSLALPALANKPFDLAPFMPIDKPLNASFEMANTYYQAQQAIDGGRMDKFVAIAGSPVMGYYDGSKLAMWRYAERFVLADHFFQAGFGGTQMNHFLLFCACMPRWPDAPQDLVAQVAADGSLVKDGLVSPDGYIVNNLRTAEMADAVPPQTMPHIGDRLDAAGISWSWYSGRFKTPPARNPVQPFAYFADLAPGTLGAAKHIKDEESFLADLKSPNLAAVVFMKPRLNEHPNSMGGLLQEDQHAAALVKAVEDSAYWQSSVVIVTYDEGHSFWDHVAPPKGDRWGPGRRIPAIIVSPFAKKGFVDHTLYDTTSILKLIETRFGLAPLGRRDAAAGDLTNAFNLR
jgi:acid phosphatase